MYTIYPYLQGSWARPLLDTARLHLWICSATASLHCQNHVYNQKGKCNVSCQQMKVLNSMLRPIHPSKLEALNHFITLWLLSLLYRKRHWHVTILCGLLHTKRSLMPWVVVTPKDTDSPPKKIPNFFFKKLSDTPWTDNTLVIPLVISCHTTHTCPSFGMTTQDVRDLFA